MLNRMVAFLLGKNMSAKQKVMKTVYRKSSAKVKGEGKVNIVARNARHDYTTSIYFSISRFCEEIVDLSAREVHHAMFAAEREGKHYCQVGDWEFTWIYMDELRQQMLDARILLYDRGVKYDCFVNTDSNKKNDIDFHHAILREADNYSKGIV